MDRIYSSGYISIDDEFVDGAIVVSPEGKIKKVLRTPGETEDWIYENKIEEIFNFGNYVLMPGLIDSHVHINEPGRTDWEGFTTATKAAAYGGFTTIVDMPLNSIPPTTTVENLKVKQAAAEGKIHVNVGFWGGIIPGNQNDLKPLLNEGVVGFKCFLCPSGVPEFPHVERKDVELAFESLEYTGGLIAFHAELCHNSEKVVDEIEEGGNSRKYETYLKTRPPTLELDAIQLVTDLTLKYESVRTHIVHLSTSEAIPLIKQCREQVGIRLTVETCHHYLSLAAEDVPDYHVEYKCCPPIRDRNNQQRLWKGIVDGDINLVVSDHSPSTPDVKMLADGADRGNFLKSWGGISSVQFGLSLFWTNCQRHGLGINDIHRLMCHEPAKLCGFENQKGRIAEGFDADFCVWDPDAQFTVTLDITQFKNKANPYLGKELKGVVQATIVGGTIVYWKDGDFETSPVGKLVKREE